MSSISTCYIIIGGKADLSVLRREVEKRHIQLVTAGRYIGRSSVVESQLSLIQASDLVVGLVAPGPTPTTVLFELGIAWAFGRRVLLIVHPDVVNLPDDFRRFMIVRSFLDNAEAIGFALDQIIAAPLREEKAISQPRASGLLGDRVDGLISELREALEQKSGEHFERVLVRALRESGVQTLFEGGVELSEGSVGWRPDMAIWDDTLQRIVGNPLLIEVKRSITSRSAMNNASHQMAAYMRSASVEWGLLLYGIGPNFDDDRSLPKNIIILNVFHFLESLRHDYLWEIVKRERDQRMFGGHI